MNRFQKIIEQITPFLLLGIGIAFAIGMLILFFYVLVWGILIGGIIWLAYFIKNYFFPANKPKTRTKGRIIEHDDNDR